MPCNYRQYPPDWFTVIRPELIARAGNRCEGSPAHPDCRAENGKPHPVTGSKVVLTVAHVSHDRARNGPEDLRHWCQRCHLTHDAPMKAEERRLTRSATLRETTERLRQELQR